MKLKNMKTFEEHSSELNISDVSDGFLSPEEFLIEWDDKLDSTFPYKFIKKFPTKDKYYSWNPNLSISILEDEFSNFPGEDIWEDFFNDLVNSDDW